MEIAEFKKYVGSLATKISNFRCLRVESAYEDLILVAVLAEELKGSIGEQDIFQLAKGGESHQASLVFQMHRQIVTLLKAMYIFSDIFISIMLSELMDRPGISLNKFLRSKKPTLTSLSMNKILPAYCVVAYRNKVIAHHDMRRVSSYTMGPGKGQYRLVPFSEKFHISKSSAQELGCLKSLYVDTVQELVNEDNQFEQLRILFYNIPIGGPGNINPDRDKIDRIAEEGGCPSMTYGEIINAVDTFTKEMVDAV